MHEQLTSLTSNYSITIGPKDTVLPVTTIRITTVDSKGRRGYASLTLNREDAVALRDSLVEICETLDGVPSRMRDILAAKTDAEVFDDIKSDSPRSERGVDMGAPEGDSEVFTGPAAIRELLNMPGIEVVDLGTVTTNGGVEAIHGALARAFGELGADVRKSMQ